MSKKEIVKQQRKILIVFGIVVLAIIIIAKINIIPYETVRNSIASLSTPAKYISYQTVCKQIKHNPDTSVTCYFLKHKHNNYYASFDYKKIAQKYQQRFIHKDNLNSIAKMRFVSAYAVYNINRQFKANIANNTITNQPGKSYDKLLEDYLANHKAKLNHLNQINYHHACQRVNFVQHDVPHKDKIKSQILNINDGNYEIQKIKSRQYVYQKYYYNGRKPQADCYTWQKVNLNGKLCNILTDKLTNHEISNSVSWSNFVKQNFTLFYNKPQFDVTNFIYKKSLQFKPKMYLATSHNIPSTQLPWPYNNFHNYNLKVLTGLPVIPKYAISKEEVEDLDGDDDEGNENDIIPDDRTCGYITSSIQNDPLQSVYLKYCISVPSIINFESERIFEPQSTLYQEKLKKANQDVDEDHSNTWSHEIISPKNKQGLKPKKLHYQYLSQIKNPYIFKHDDPKEKYPIIVRLKANHKIKRKNNYIAKYPYGLINQNNYQATSPTDQIPNIAHSARINLQEKAKFERKIKSPQTTSVPYLVMKHKNLMYNSYNNLAIQNSLKKQTEPLADKFALSKKPQYAIDWKFTDTTLKKSNTHWYHVKLGKMKYPYCIQKQKGKFPLGKTRLTIAKHVLSKKMWNLPSKPNSAMKDKAISNLLTKQNLHNFHYKKDGNLIKLSFTIKDQEQSIYRFMITLKKTC